MTQIQIENLSTEEYSYFLGHGVLDYIENDDQSLPFDRAFKEDCETSDGSDERVLSQNLENVCCLEE